MVAAPRTLKVALVARAVPEMARSSFGPGVDRLRLAKVATPLASVCWVVVPLNEPVPLASARVMTAFVTAAPAALVATMVTAGEMFAPTGVSVGCCWKEIPATGFPPPPFCALTVMDAMSMAVA